MCVLMLFFLRSLSFSGRVKYLIQFLWMFVCVCVFFRSFSALSMMLNFEFLSRAPNIGEKARICILQFKWTGKTGFAPIQPCYGFLWDLSMYLLGDHKYTVWEREREKNTYICVTVWVGIWKHGLSSVYASRTKTNNSIFLKKKKNSIRRNRVYVVLLSFIFLHSLRSAHSEEILYHAQAYTRTCSSSSISSFFIYCIVYVVVVVLFLVDWAHFWLLIGEKRFSTNRNVVWRSFQYNWWPDYTRAPKL